MGRGTLKIGQMKPETAEITLDRITDRQGMVRMTIREVGQAPLFDHVLAMHDLSNYRREPFDDGTLRVTYLFSRDRASLQFATDGEDHRLVILREPFERLLAAV